MYVFSNKKPELLTEQAFQSHLRLVEEFFRTKEDNNQINIGDISLEEEKRIFPHTLNLIFHNDEVIGATDILPCTQTYMREFLNHKISEPELLARVKKDFIERRLTYRMCDAIYLVSAFLKPKHRKKGLAIDSFIDSIARLNIFEPTLFYWEYSEEGRNLSRKLAEKLKLKILAR